MHKCIHIQGAKNFDFCGSSDIGHCFIARVNEITDQGFVCFDDPILCSDPLIGWN